MYNDVGDFMLYLSEIGFENTKELYFWSKLPFYKALSQGNCLSLDSPVTFIVGENGSGKSTRIEAIAVAKGFLADPERYLKQLL